MIFRGHGNITDLNVTFGASRTDNVTVLGTYRMDDVMAGERTWATQDLGMTSKATKSIAILPQHQRERSSIDPVPMGMRLGM